MKNIIVLLCLLFQSHAWKTYEGYCTYSVFPQSEAQNEELHSILLNDPELDVWKDSRGVGDDAHVMVPPEKCDKFEDKMLQDGFEVDIHVLNVGDMVADFKASMDERRGPDGRMVFDLNNYNNLEDTYSQLEIWEADCQEGVTCELQPIGNSYEGREVLMLSMSTGEARETIYADSLTHPREKITGTAVNNIINKMVYEYGTDENVTYMLDNYDWFFVPVVNPDGYHHVFEEDDLWRKNREPNPGSICIGTDINRNFDTGFWGTDGTSQNPCSQVYPGLNVSSSVEAQNIQTVLDMLQPKIMVSIHAYSNIWLQPHGHTIDGVCAITEEPLHSNMMAAGQAAIDAIMEVGGEDNWIRGPVCSTFYPAAGGTIDYPDFSTTLYSYTPELRGLNFTPPVEQIPIAFEETWAGIVAMVLETENH